MKNKLSCEQVAALFTFFVEDKLSPKLSQYMREHLELCPECMNKYIEIHPNSNIVEMDTVIGTSGGKGGKCFLTLLFRQYNFMLIYLLFRQYNFMLIYLLPYKQSKYVYEVFNNLKYSL